MQTKLLRLSDVAKMHGVTYRTARNWTQRKQNPLRAFRRGGRVYVTQEALDEFSEPVNSLPNSHRDPSQAELDHLWAEFG
jgi:hypothetical protein